MTITSDALCFYIPLHFRRSSPPILNSPKMCLSPEISKIVIDFQSQSTDRLKWHPTMFPSRGGTKPLIKHELGHRILAQLNASLLRRGYINIYDVYITHMESQQLPTTLLFPLPTLHSSGSRHSKR
uniref:Uncharacterized protein n=1 Tax=Ditylum brightwellii TaxID=49249 RepID=A0A7S4S7E6_9STRA